MYIDDALNLTIIIGGISYWGDLPRWAEYARAIAQGKLDRYKETPHYRNQTLQNFFGQFRALWDDRKGPLPKPEQFGLISQSRIIDRLIEA
jgi:hypothetical protein